jgi:hypothetical protein
MRSMICASAAFALVLPLVPTLASAAEVQPAEKAAAASVGDFAKSASDRGPVLAHGYSERTRRIADCLATYPGYDPRTDRVVVRPGVVKRCTL